MDEGEKKKKLPSLPPDYVSLAQLKEIWLQKQKEKKLQEEQKQREESRNEGGLKNENIEKDGPLVGVTEQEAVPSLPPDYVSLSQLKEIWLQKQKEKKLQEKQKQREESRNEGGLENENIEKDGPLVGVIEQEAGKGKAIEQIDSFGNGEGKKNARTRKKKKKHSKTIPPLVAEKNENPTVEDKCGFDGVDGEIKRKNGYKNVNNVGGNEYVVGTLHDESSGEAIYGKSQGIKETITVPMANVLRRDGVSEEVSKVKSVRVRAGFGRNGRRNELNELKINEAEMSLEKKVADGKGNGKDFADTRINGDNRGSGYRKKEYRVKINESGISSGKKEGDEKEKVENKRHGKKGKNVTDEKEKVMDGTDKRRNCESREIAYSLEESGAAVQGSKGKKVELKSENIAEDEALEADRKIDGLDGIDSNGIGGQVYRVESESLNDTTNIAPEKKAQDEDSVVGKPINGGNGKARNGSRRYQNWSRNGGRKSEKQAWSDVSANSTRSKKETNVGNESSGRSEGRKVKQIGGRMVWVKKEHK